MRWWDNLWLNEGFATFVEYIGANHISDGDFQMVVNQDIDFCYWYFYYIIWVISFKDDYFIEAAQESAMEDDKVARYENVGISCDVYPHFNIVTFL